MSKPVPKGYKQTKVGVIPDDWEINSFSKVIKPAIRKVDKPSKAYWRLGLRSHGKGTFHELVENPENISMDKLYVIKKNDLIVNITFAWEHAIALANKEDENKLVSHRFPTYQFNSGSSPIFYKYYVLQPRFKYELKNISPGGAGRNRVMNKKDFLKLEIPLPPLKEQQKIAEILATWDKAIEKQQALIKAEEQLKKGLMQQLLTGKTRFAGFSEKWQEVRFGDMASFFSGGTPTSSNKEYYSGNIPFIGSGDISSNTVDKYITTNALKNSSAKLINKGDLLYALYGATSGEVSISKINGAINQAVLCIRCNQNIDFLYKYLSLSKEKIVSTFLQGGQGNLSAKIIKNLKIPLPPLQEQQKIAEVLSNSDNEILLLTKELEELILQKKALMQQLLTGKMRVKI